MASHVATITRISLASLRYTGFSRIPAPSFFPRNSVPLGSPQVICSRNLSSFPFSMCSRNLHVTPFEAYAKGLRLGPSQIGFKQFSSKNHRVSAVSDGGATTGTGGNDGTGGFGGSKNGGGGGGDSGGSGGSGDGGSSWSFLSWYLSLLSKYPVWTKAITSAILTFVGDLTCQLVIDQVSSLDVKRTFIFTLLGLVMVGPSLHFWYLFLSKLVTNPGASGAFLRLLLDQFLFAPIFIGTFLATLVTLEGRPSEVIPKLQQEWFSSVLANWQLWIPFQFLNFRFVPQQFQVLAANFIALIWNVILSYKAHKEVLAK